MIWDVYVTGEKGDRVAGQVDAATQQAALTAARKTFASASVQYVKESKQAPAAPLQQATARPLQAPGDTQAAQDEGKYPARMWPQNRGYVQLVAQLKKREKEQLLADLQEAGITSVAGWIRENWQTLRSKLGKEPFAD